MTNVIDFTPEHIKILHDGAMPSFVAHLGQCGPAFTILVDGELMACTGLHVYPWNTTGEAWAMLAPSLFSNLKAALAVTRTIKTLLDRSITNLHMVRVQATVREGDTMSIRWAKSLGFHYESKLEKYGPDGNYLMYAKISQESSL